MLFFYQCLEGGGSSLNPSYFIFQLIIQMWNITKPFHSDIWCNVISFIGGQYKPFIDKGKPLEIYSRDVTVQYITQYFL